MTDVAPERSARGRSPSGGNIWDVVIAAIFGIVVALLLWHLVQTYDPASARWALLLCGTVGMALGWCAGILLSPYGKTERESFAGIAKLISGFLTGYVLSKVDPLISDTIGKVGATPSATLAMIGAAVTITAFAVAATITYVSRVYWR